MTARPFQGREERSGRRVVAAVARTSTASGCEGNEPHQRWVRAPDASCEWVTERYM